jgi:hypothetical protein
MSNFCCSAGTKVGQCKRPTGASCQQSAQCCNSCVAGSCT